MPLKKSQSFPPGTPIVNKKFPNKETSIVVIKKSVVITEGHRLVREALSFILDTDTRFKVVAEAGSADAAIKLARNSRPKS